MNCSVIVNHEFCEIVKTPSKIKQIVFSCLEIALLFSDRAVTSGFQTNKPIQV